MKHLKMQFAKVKEWWKPETGTVSMWDLIMARLLVKLSTGLTYILSPVVRVMSKIQLAALETRSQAKVTISLRTIQKIKPAEFKWQQGTGVGFVAQTVASWSAHNIPTGAIGAQGSPVNSPINYTPSSITFQTPSKPVLVITNDGDVEWHGKPSEAANILVRSFGMAVENAKGVTKAARRRYYWKAVDNLSRKSKQMSAEQFVDFVQKQAYNRESRVLIDTLKGKDL